MPQNESVYTDIEDSEIEVATLTTARKIKNSGYEKHHTYD